VQYRASGFLRGGTGDEYPILPMAEKGLCVFVFERPNDWISEEHLSGPQYLAAEFRDLSDRRRVLSSLESGISLLVSEKGIDACRVGLTGLSDGADTAYFAMINSKMFQVYALSAFPASEKNFWFTTAPQYRRSMDEWGLGRPGSSSDKYWDDLSITNKFDRISSPILVQVSDREFRGVEAFVSLREAGRPVEAHVFEDEAHIKFYPVHRKSIYQRNIDWLRFWLQGFKDPAPFKQAQYSRWTELKTRQAALKPDLACHL
jgi:hypothetical protein